MKTFTVKLSQAPRNADWQGKLDHQGRPMAPPKPQALPDLKVQGRNIDRAREAARKKIIGVKGHRLRSLSCGTDGNLHAIVFHPEDALADKPRP
jgi:hypothetical protein